MQRSRKLSASLAIAGWLLCSTSWLAAEEDQRQQVLFFTRNVGYEHAVVHRDGEQLSHAEKILTEMGRRASIEVTCTKDGRVFDEDIDRYGAFAFYTNNDLTLPNKRHVPPMSAAGKARLLKAVAGGKGFVGFHSTCASWRTTGAQSENRPDAVDPFLAMLGGEFVAHGAQQQATMRVVSRKFPGVEQLGGAFTLHEEWYGLKNFADDLHVVLVQETARMKGNWYQRPPYPATWARRHGRGRVFYTSMGHRKDVWTNDQFQEIVLGGLAWALGNVDVDVTPNIRSTTPSAGQLAN